MKIYNNNISSLNYLFIFQYEYLNEDIKDHTIKWFLNCLDNIEDNSIYNNNEYCFNILIDNNNTNNTLNILLHLNNNNIYFSNNNCIIKENHNNYLDINKLDNILNNNYYKLHKNISNIGINGISNNLIKQLWWKYLNGERGYNYNTMLKKYKNKGWIETTDQSYKFNWDNYPLVKL